MDGWSFWESEAARGGGEWPPLFAPSSILQVLGYPTWQQRSSQHDRRRGIISDDYYYNYADADTEDHPTEPLVVLPPPPPGSSATQGHAAAAVPPSNKRGRAPASSKAIEGLREVTAAMDGSDDCCAICLQEFDARLDPEAPAPGLRAMPCSHTFHQRCISEWLRRNAVCPLCRHELPTEEKEKEDDEDQLEHGRSTSRRRIVYDEERGRHFLVLLLTDGPFITEEEEEQELARLDSMLQGQQRTTPQS